MSVKLLKSAIPKSIIKELQQLADRIHQEIYSEYFDNLSYIDFVKLHLRHSLPSGISRIAAFRFAHETVIKSLVKYLLPLISEVYGISNLLLHPIFYLRLSIPDKEGAPPPHKVFFESQPHYDRSFGLNAFSFWIPLETINQETGGLCSFTDKTASSFFTEIDGRNKYNYQSYLSVAKTIDPIMEPITITHYAEIGDVLTFDSQVLHGATMPSLTRRLSFDFRLVPQESVTAEMQMFRSVNESLDVCNALNLIYMGDFIGAEEILERLDSDSQKSTHNFIWHTLVKFKSKSTQTLFPDIVRWQDEYAWLNSTA